MQTSDNKIALVEVSGNTMALVQVSKNNTGARAKLKLSWYVLDKNLMKQR